MTYFRGSPVRAAVAGAVLTLATAAHAADLPSRTITPVAPALPAPAFSFTGFYVGATAGGDFLSKGAITTALATGFAVDPTSSYAKYDDARVRVGGYIGYNYQIDQVVVGVEGDGGYDFGKARTTAGIPGTIAYVAAVSATNNDSTISNSKYDASARVRVGVVLLPTLMFYATGGVAFRDSSFGVNCPGNGAASWCSQPEAATYSTTRIGWTVGGGLEGPIYDNLVARIEYRYSDFGGRTLGFFGPPAGASGDYLQFRTNVSASTVTLGLAYKFGSPAPAPVVARY